MAQQATPSDFPPTEAWLHGAAYEPYVGRWSRLVAREFLAWLRVGAGRRWLDVGCGTGALTETILEETAPAEVVGVDPSPGYVAYARRRVTDRRARFEAGDARALPLVSGAFDAVVSGLVLNVVPDPDQALAEMRRTARGGGTIAGYVFDHGGKMEFLSHFWDAASALDPAARELDQQRRCSICQPEALGDLFGTAGLRAIEVRAIDVQTVFRDFDDYWSPFLGGQGVAPRYVLALTPERRATLRERIRAALPTAADGSISLAARAWAVRGVN